tara:strand:+ start:246 stop:710 length:465 start_codon:yes stop_codon:yes gene_type:complete
MTIHFGDSTNISTATGLGSKIKQIVRSTRTSKFATTSTSYVDCGFSCSITPSSSSNKILIITSLNAGAGQDGQNNKARVLRGSTNISEVDQSIRMPNAYHVNTFVHLFTDSPNTTSSVTYKYQVKAESNEVFLNRGGGNNHRGFCAMILIEYEP